MKRLLLLLTATFAVAFCIHGLNADENKLKVVATLPDIASVAREIGGDFVEVDSLTTAFDEPHTVTPKPSLMVKVNQADLFIEVGLELEIWSEKVLEGARNPKVRVGQPGHVYASEGVETLEKPKIMSRSEGDVHSQGNPHIWLNPLNVIKMAENIKNGLNRIAPEHSKAFEKNFGNFRDKIYEKLYGRKLVDLLGGDTLASLHKNGRLIEFLKEKKYKEKPLIEILSGWMKKMLPNQGREIITYHRSWSYLTDSFGLKVAMELEPKPGISPSASHLAEVVKTVQQKHIKVVLVEPFYSRKAADFVADKTDAQVVVCATSVGGEENVNDYFSLIDNVVKKLTDVWEKK
ncbi:MAG: metal ABC transporter substrate-binding protein [Planctomycetota bacterium]